MKKELLEISVKQPFANSGILERVPYTLPPQDDDLNWLEGFTDAFQRPVIVDDLGAQRGRYIKMGQLNKVLQDTSQAILNVKQGLDNVAKHIDEEIASKIDKILQEANKAITTAHSSSYLRTSTNQNCAGLKNFTGVTDTNFKTTPNAVANLKYCNGLPIKTYYENKSVKGNTNYTAQHTSLTINMMLIDDLGGTLQAMTLNNKDYIYTNPDNKRYSFWDPFFAVVALKDVYSFKAFGNYYVYVGFGI